MSATPNRNTQIGIVFDHLNGKDKPIQDVLTEVSNLKHIDPPVHTNEYADYRYKVETDKKFSVLVPEIMAALGKVRYAPAYMDPEGRKAIIDGNDAVRVEVAQLIEKHGVPYVLLDNIVTDIGGNLQNIIKGAVTTLNNKTGECFMHMARERFGTDDVTMAHIAQYAKEVYDKAEADKKK